MSFVSFLICNLLGSWLNAGRSLVRFLTLDRRIDLSHLRHSKAVKTEMHVCRFGISSLTKACGMKSVSTPHPFHIPNYVTICFHLSSLRNRLREIDSEFICIVVSGTGRNVGRQSREEIDAKKTVLSSKLPLWPLELNFTGKTEGRV